MSEQGTSADSRRRNSRQGEGVGTNVVPQSGCLCLCSVMQVPESLPITHLLRGALSLRCPICLEGHVFDGLFQARRRCGVCGYFFARESGYFAGSVVMGYGATLVGVAGLWILLSQVMGMGWDLRVLVALAGFALVFPVWFFRYARMFWMVLDLYLNPPVREDFEPRGR